MNDAKELLLHRFNLLCSQGNFDDVYAKGYYVGSEMRKAYEMFKNGTLSIGFIGLWDAISVLENQKINSIDDMKRNFNLAYSIVKIMREYTDEATKTEKLNFSLLASAAEGVTGNFAQYDSMNLGREYDVCKKGFYTNSFHVPVNLSANYKEKIDMEGRFHFLCNGGSITYIELNEMPGINVEAVKEIVEYAYENDCNYIGINFPMDNCKACGFIGRITDNCPCCKSTDIRKLRRVSGYLSEEKSFTSGKHKELEQRKSHMSFNGLGE
jgi:ribonucleoside-triphosphate reductase